EANTIPGMTETSLLPKAAAEAGLNYQNLCLEIIQISLNIS
ncbi:MAG: D-alanine--D-alanine ligase, partial [Verrucomicrobiota bacterium]